MPKESGCLWLNAMRCGHRSDWMEDMKKISDLAWKRSDNERAARSARPRKGIHPAAINQVKREIRLNHMTRVWGV